MRRILHPGVLALVCMLMLPAAVMADTTYITDKVPIELYSSTFQRGVLVTTLQSGAIVEVIETDADYSKIRTLDGQEGWLKSSYLSSEKPMQANYLQLMAKHKQLQEEVEQLKSQLKSSEGADKEKAISDKLRKDLAQAKNTISGLEKQLKEKSDALVDVQKQLQALKNQPLNKPESSVPAVAATETDPVAPQIIPQPQTESQPIFTTVQNSQEFNFDYPIALKWTLIASLLCMLLGSYLGYTWLDNKIRKRHGGVRIR